MSYTEEFLLILSFELVVKEVAQFLDLFLHAFHNITKNNEWRVRLMLYFFRL